MKKRLSALLLTLIMVLSMVPQAAFATGDNITMPADVAVTAGDSRTVPADAAFTSGVKGTAPSDIAVAAENETAVRSIAKDPEAKTVLAFTSDVHNKVTNESAERLDSWINNVQNIHGKIDVFAFGGDMGDSDDETYFWHNTQVCMNVVKNHGISGVYTTGNHEYSTGNYSSSSTEAVQQSFKINTEGAAGSNYRVYCLGTDGQNSGNFSYEKYTTNTWMSSVESLRTYLNSVGNDKPIFIITHYPLHYFENENKGVSRSITNADSVIDTINDAVTRNHQTIVFIWGHNHSIGDTHYNRIFTPGESIQYDENGNSKALNFYYCAAGCMSDSENIYNDPVIAGKGLVVTINQAKQLSFTYYGVSGTDVTEGGTFTWQDPVPVSSASITDTEGQPVTASVNVRKGSAVRLCRSVSPADAAVETVSWESSAPSVATVNGTGKVIGISEGTAVITVKVKDAVTGSVYTANAAVTVSARADNVYYMLTDSLEDSKDYLIVSAGTAGPALALSNNGSAFSGIDFGSFPVEIASGDISGDGVADLYIDTDEDDIIWTASANGSGFNLVNGVGYLEGSFADVRVFDPQKNVDRYWTYTDRFLEHKGGPNVYNLFYLDGFEYVRNKADQQYNKSEIYIYEQVEIAAPTRVGAIFTDENGEVSRQYVSVSDINRTTGGSFYNTTNICTYTCTIYLPFGVDPADCCFFWDGGMNVTYGNASYTSGHCPLPPVMNVPATYTFTEGNNTWSYDITVRQGSMYVEPSDNNGIPSRINVHVSDAVKTTGGTGTGTATEYTYTCQLYMPGSVDLTDCRFSWAGDIEVVSEDVVYSSGECPVPAAGQERTYTFTDGSTVWEFNVTCHQGSPLPVVQQVFIEIDESRGTIAELKDSKDNSCSGTIYINGEEYELSRIKGRGNATWTDYGYFKKPYNVKLEKKISFPGTGAEKTKNWSFLAEGADPSLLCNRTGLYLATQLGVGYGTASADVWMNGEYQGCYTVTPKTDSYVSKNGYMIENDNYLEDPVENGGDPQFSLAGLYETEGWSSAYNRITVKKMGDNFLGKDASGEVDESPENMTAKADLIRAWLQDAWDAIRDNGSLPGYNNQRKYYTDYIDIESFAKIYLIQEFVKNYDICAGSLLFHRDGTGAEDKLFAGPLWDLDNSFGSTYQNNFIGPADDRVNGDRRSAEGDFIINVREDGYKTSIYKTIGRLADFMEEVYRQYNLHRSEFQSLAAALEGMKSDDTGIMASAKMNHSRAEYKGDTNHKYESGITLGSGQYTQDYLATGDPAEDWDYYAANLYTYVTVRSQWFMNNYTRSLIIFDTAGGNEIKAIVGVAGSAIDPRKLPADPVKEGFTFAGWDKDIPETMPEEDLVITALWAENYTVTFVNEDGTVLQSSEVAEGAIPVYNGEIPTKEASEPYVYTFAGWTDGTSEYAADAELPPVSGNVIYTALFIETLPIRFAASISLDAQIALNAYVGQLPRNVDLSEFTAKVYSGEEEIATVPFTTLTGYSLTPPGGVTSTYYYLKIADLAAKCMTDEYTVKVFRNGTELAEEVFSIRGYCESRLEEGSGASSKNKKLCRATLTYGAEAQKHFKYKTDDLADKNITRVKLTTIPEDYAITDDPTLTGISRVGTSGSFESQVYLNLYFVPESGKTIDDFTFSVELDGEECEFEKNAMSSGWIHLQLPSVEAKKLGTSFDITVKNNATGVSATWHRSALNYAYITLQGNASATMKNLVRGLYQYYLAAK